MLYAHTSRISPPSLPPSLPPPLPLPPLPPVIRSHATELGANAPYMAFQHRSLQGGCIEGGCIEGGRDGSICEVSIKEGRNNGMKKEGM
jgi:hypothetical protein